MGDRVRVLFTKYDGRRHWRAEVDRLGEDEHGVWLGAAARTVWYRGERGPIRLHRQAILIPWNQWWVGSFFDDHPHHDIYLDLASPALWTGPDDVTMIDLDLDVIRSARTGQATLLDEDEFAEHQVAMAYPSQVIESVTGTAAQLMRAVATEEPFVSAYRPWLARVA